MGDPFAVNLFGNSKLSLLKQFDHFIDGVLNFGRKVFGTQPEKIVQ